MRLFKFFWWIFTGCPLYIAGISAGAAVAVAAAAAGAIAQGVSASQQGKAAKGAAKTQAIAADQAAKEQEAAMIRANEVAKSAYDESQGFLKSGLQQSTATLQPYANVGAGALGQLTALTHSPIASHGAIAGRAASGTDANTLAKIMAEQQAANNARSDFNSKFEQHQNNVGWDQASKDLSGELSKIEQRQRLANQAVMEANARPYDPGQTAQDAYAGDNGGDLYRGFSAQDYINDPTSGGNEPQDLSRNFDQAAWLKSQGRSAYDYNQQNNNFSTDDIKGWLANHQGASDAEIAKAMRDNGVSVQQLAAATGLPISDINRRLNVISTSQSNSPTALTDNFDQSAWLQSQGIDPRELIKNFDQSAWLASMGRGPRALTEDFNQEAFLQAGGHNTGDLSRDFNRSNYLRAAGFNEADLARGFKLSDYQADPGYQFRLDEGNRGINNSAAASGGLLSGATLKAIAKYNSDQASQEYGNAFNRFQSTQQQAGNALNNAQVAFNANRADLNNSLTSAFNRFGSNRSNLSNEAMNAYNQFGANRANLAGRTDTAYNQFGANRANLSGELMNAYNRFGNDRSNAASVYQNSRNNWTGDRTNTFNRLAAMAGIGQQAAGQQAGYQYGTGSNLANAATNYGSTVGNNLQAIGNARAQGANDSAQARAQGQIANANAVSSGIQGVGNALTSGLQNYQQQQYLNNMGSATPYNSGYTQLINNNKWY